MPTSDELPTIGPYRTLMRLATSREKSHHETFVAKCITDTGGITKQVVVLKAYSLARLRVDHKLRLWTERNVLTLRQADHPHIVRTLPSFLTATDLFLVEEFCEFGELFEVVEKNNEDIANEALERQVSVGTSPPRAPPVVQRYSPDGLPSAVALRLFHELMLAVEYCHDELGVCHRDIKLENIMLSDTSAVKLCNFGMAAALPAALKRRVVNSSSTDTHRQETVHIDDLLSISCGSRHYASPEIVRGEPYDGALADVYSCGVVLYSLVTGGFPTTEESQARDAGAPSPPDVASLSSFKAIQSAPMRELILGMLDVEDRRLTVREVLRRVRTIRGLP